MRKYRRAQQNIYDYIGENETGGQLQIISGENLVLKQAANDYLALRRELGFS